MAVGETTVQQVLDAVSEQVALIDGIVASHSTDIRIIQKTPTIIFSWFSDIDTSVTSGSDELWIIAAKATLYHAPIRGNELRPNISNYNDLVHDIIKVINVHPQRYPYGSKMSELYGVSRVQVTRVRPAEFGLEYAGHRYFGAELFLDIKLHRRIDY
jgi:hypothetical protein